MSNTQNVSLNAITAALAKNLNPSLAYTTTANENLAEDLADIVNKHALGAAAAGLGVAWLPGAGSLAAAAALAGFLWSMYFRINNRIGLKLSKVMLKSLASAVLSNLAQAAISIAGYTLLASVISLTGAGGVISSALMAALDYAVVLVGGIIYLKLLNGLFAVGRNPQDMNEEEIKLASKDVIADSKVSQMLKNARGEYKQMSKAGKATLDSKLELVED